MTESDRKPFITRVRIRNYKSIADCDVALGPLTVLVGPNAAGKSNFLDALRFVYDAIVDSPSDALRARGWLDSVLYRGDGSSAARAESFSVDIELAVPWLNTGETFPAAYSVEIGHDPFGVAQLVVLRESCELHLPVRNGLVSCETDRPARGEGWRVLRGSELSGSRIKLDELFIGTLGVLEPFDLLLDALQAPRYYDLDTSVLSAFDDTPPGVRGDKLGQSGEYLANVLGLLATDRPSVKETIDGYLAAMIDNALSVDQASFGDIQAVTGRFLVRGQRFADPVVEVFQRRSLSEGTLRLSGVLAALFQPRALTGEIPFVGIEEPEKAIHPPRVGSLYEALVAASRNTQVMVTTQSADLLDSESADVGHILVAVNQDGATRVGPLDEVGVSLVADKTMTLSELLRSGLMRPVIVPGEGAAP